MSIPRPSQRPIPLARALDATAALDATGTHVGLDLGPRAGRATAVHLDTTSRDRILDVAESLFAERGFAGVGLREVAQQVGLGKSSLFHHFPTKRALYEEVLARALCRIETRVASGLAEPSGAATRRGPTERLDHWVDALIDALAEHPATARLALRSLFEEPIPPAAGRAAWEDTLGRLVEGFQRLLHAGIAAGAFRRVSVGHLTQTVIGATVYHFASSGFGEEVTGAPLFSAGEVARRKTEVKRLLRSGVSHPARGAEEQP